MALRKPSWGSQLSLDHSDITSPDRRRIHESVTTNLLVTNLPSKITFFTLASHFTTFPSFVGLRLLAMRPHEETRSAFLNFESAIDAENVIREFDQRPPYNFRVRLCLKDRERNANENCENGQFSHSYFHGDGENLADINFGVMAINITPGFDGRRIVVNDNPANCFSDRPEFCRWQEKSEMFDVVSQNRQYRNNNACGDGFNRFDSQRLSEREKRFDSKQQRSNGYPQHEPKFNRGSQGQRNFSNAVEDDDDDDRNRNRNMAAKSNQRSDFNKYRQRAKSCDRLSSYRSNHSGSVVTLHDEDIDDDEIEKHPSYKNQVNHNRRNLPINDNRVTRNSHETQDTASELSSADDNYLQAEHVEFEVGKTIRCTITHVEGNGIFWAQTDPSFADKLETSLAEDAKRIMGKKIKFIRGGIYLVQYECDSMWYRGKILKVNEQNSKVDVLFIDYGNSSFNVSTNKVKALSPDKRKYPAQAIKCKPSRTTVNKYPSCQAFCVAIAGNECDLTVASICADYYVVTVDVCSGGPIPNFTERSLQTEPMAPKRVKEAPKESLSDMMLKLKNSKQKNEFLIREDVGEKSRSTPTPLLKPQEADRSKKLTPEKQSAPVHQSKPKMNGELGSSGEELTKVMEMNVEPKSSGEQPAEMKINEEPKSSGEQPDKIVKMSEESKPLLEAIKMKEVDNSPKENVSLHMCTFIISQLNVDDKFGLFPMVPDSPSSLWGTVDSADSFKNLAAGFDPVYENLDEVLISAPIGSLVVAKSNAYGNWGRVVVLANDTDEPEVFFVDFGNKETVSVMKPILDQHKTLPGLVSYGEIDTTTLSEDEKAALAKCLGEEVPIQMVVIEKLDNDRIKAAMLDYKMAPCVLRSGQFLIDNKLNKNDKPLVTVENLPRFEKGLRTDALLVEIFSTKQIHICPAAFYEAIAKLEGESPSTVIRETYAPRVKELVLAKYSATGQMYRAEVTRVEKDHASVLFIDYGNQEDVSLNEIFEISEELLKVPLCIVAVKDDPQAVERLKGFISETLTMYVVDEGRLPAIVEFYKNNVNVLSEG